MKITLILTSYPGDPLRKNDPFMPLSLPLLAACAPEHDYTLIDMLAGENIDFTKPCDLVGLSVRITAENTARKIANKFREKGIKVIVGGPHISSIPFKAKEFADAVVIGEAESLWPIIINDIQNNQLKDFYVCSDKKFNPGKLTIHQINTFPDLKNIPIANRSLLKKHNYVFDTVFASRGCPVNCDFCSVTNTFGSKVRTRPVNDVVKEISTFKKYYYLLDDTVFGRPSNYDYYLELYSKLANLKKINFWTGQANLDACATEKGRKVVIMSAKAGFLYAAIGMESINPLILKKSGVIKKLGIGNEKDILKKTKEHIQFIQDQGIVISGWFTIGYKEDNINTFYSTYEFCKKMNIIPIISPLEALPGTILYERIKKENRLVHNKRLNILHPEMSDDQIFKALDEINKKAFSMKEIFNRTKFYAKKFDKNNTNISSKIENKIHKTIFTWITQLKLKKGVTGFSGDETS